MSKRLGLALLGAALSLLTLAAPLAARAEPAVIAVFEAVARAEPSPTAPAVQTLIEGAAVSVSEEATAGWRRVRLADGRTAWIEERALAFPARRAAEPPSATPPPPAVASPAQPSAPLSVAVPAPDLRPRVYVKDLDHLAELVKSDARAGPLASRLVARRTSAWVTGGVGLVVAAGCFVYAGSEFSRHSSVNDPQFGHTGNAGPAFTLGMVTGTAAVLAAAIIMPKRTDVLDVINTWNETHPLEPFTINEHLVGR